VCTTVLGSEFRQYSFQLGKDSWITIRLALASPLGDHNEQKAKKKTAEAYRSYQPVTGSQG
jgi:hypothetical protein